jgi:hypothetical protein
VKRLVGIDRWTAAVRHPGLVPCARASGAWASAPPGAEGHLELPGAAHAHLDSADNNHCGCLVKRKRRPARSFRELGQPSRAPRQAAPLARRCWPLAGSDAPSARRGGAGPPPGDRAGRSNGRGHRRFAMLRIYSTVIEVMRGLRPVIRDIEEHNRDLAKQLRRASAMRGAQRERGKRLP